MKVELRPLFLSAVISLSAACTEGIDVDEVLFTCGDGQISGSEQCDDGNRFTRDGCSGACTLEPGFSCSGEPSICRAVCGDSWRRPGETCDDGNAQAGDGCSRDCKTEAGWDCDRREPSFCIPTCGDGIRVGSERCDDNNAMAGDGCDGNCFIEANYTCTGTITSVCTPICGDGMRLMGEACDDNNAMAGDGCSAECTIEMGYQCDMASPTICYLCGDGQRGALEACDDNNTMAGDGCDPQCAVEAGYQCDMQSPTICTPICGDGLRLGSEACDDNNMMPGDGCNSQCALEPGFICENPANSPTRCRPRWAQLTAPSAELPPLGTTIYTGSEIIYWGGGLPPADLSSEGHRYQIRGNRWVNTSANNSPSPRSLHSAVWTGQEMLIFGGEGSQGYLGDGGLYNPQSNSWTSISSTTARSLHTAVWTGQEMLVFGGVPNSTTTPSLLRYQPSNQRWSQGSTLAPSRTEHSATWTGQELLIYGGRPLAAPTQTVSDFIAYNPSTDSFRSLNSGPLTPRAGHQAVWTGQELIIWGGEDSHGVAMSDGARYTPSTDSWQTISTQTLSRASGAVFMNTQLLFWEADSQRALQYSPSDDRWALLDYPAGPQVVLELGLVWTSTQALFLGSQGLYRLVPEQP